METECSPTPSSWTVRFWYEPHKHCAIYCPTNNIHSLSFFIPIFQWWKFATCWEESPRNVAIVLSYVMISNLFSMPIPKNMKIKTKKLLYSLSQTTMARSELINLGWPHCRPTTQVVAFSFFFFNRLWLVCPVLFCNRWRMYVKPHSLLILSCWTRPSRYYPFHKQLWLDQGVAKTSEVLWLWLQNCVSTIQCF